MSEVPNHNQLPVNPAEQQLREQMLSQIEAESAGTVALHTHMPVTEAQKASMAEIQTARGGQPSNGVTATEGHGGWGQYGERKAQNPLRVDEGESVDFVPLEDGRVDVRYGFTRNSGYNDEHSRPGNKLQVQFILPSTSAGKLREALQADPSFINDVVKRQVSVIGIDTESPRSDWKDRLEPHYYDRRTFTVMPDKDRVLNIRDTDASGENVIAEEALTYGENKSLDSLLPEEQLSPATETVTSPDQLAVHQDHAQLTQEVVVGWGKDYARQEAEGKTPAEILNGMEATYANEVDAQNEAKARGDTRAVAESQAVLDGLDVLHSRYTELSRKDSAVSSARDGVDIIHAEIAAAAPVEKTPTLNGEPVTISERYNDANGTEWVVVGQRHIKASQLDK